MPVRPAHTTCVVLSEHLSIYLNRREFTLADLPLLPQHVDTYLVPSNLAAEVIAVCRKRGAALLTYAGVRPGLPTIGPDNRAGARMVTAHLIAHRRQRIVHLAGLPDSDESQERIAGYREALDAAGIQFDPALRYIVSSGPHTAISAQRGGAGESLSAQRASAAGVEHWQGPAAAFPPPAWLAPGDTLLLTPVESGAQQRMLFGVVEEDGQAYIDLDDQLLRSINTYRSITVLNQTRQELDAARSVQLSLLPRHPPASEHYDIAGATRAARQVGGDLYGYYVRAGAGLALAVGDVAGKGMPAALLMSTCATALAGTIQRNLPPGQTLAEIHQVLRPSIGRGQNAAICLAYLDGPRVRIANAGAVAPIVLDRDGAHVVDVGGLPLGTPLSTLRPYTEVELTLAPDDVLILSSNGIVEARNEGGEMYGFERLLAAIARGRQKSAQQILAHLFGDVAAFGGEVELHDDMAIVVARYRG